jgi:hypothetical protein
MGSIQGIVQCIEQRCGSLEVAFLCRALKTGSARYFTTRSFDFVDQKIRIGPRNFGRASVQSHAGADLARYAVNGRGNRPQSGRVLLVVGGITVLPNQTELSEQPGLRCDCSQRVSCQAVLSDQVGNLLPRQMGWCGGGNVGYVRRSAFAVLLAVELLLFEWKPRSMIPVALASATAGAARRYIMGLGPLFPVAPHPAFIGPQGLAVAGHRRPGDRTWRLGVSAGGGCGIRHHRGSDPERRADEDHHGCSCREVHHLGSSAGVRNFRRCAGSLADDGGRARRD